MRLLGCESAYSRKFVTEILLTGTKTSSPGDTYVEKKAENKSVGRICGRRDKGGKIRRISCRRRRASGIERAATGSRWGGTTKLQFSKMTRGNLSGVLCLSSVHAPSPLPRPSILDKKRRGKKNGVGRVLRDDGVCLLLNLTFRRHES